jgi:mitochondrial fission protein ELM1
MVSEALVAGKPVATVPLEGHARRHKLFIDNLRAKGAITRFDGTLPPPSNVIIPNATQHAADAVRDLLGIGPTVN